MLPIAALVALAAASEDDARKHTMKKTIIGGIAAAATATGALLFGAAPAYANGEWWDTPSMGQAVCSVVKVGGRDYAVNYAFGDLNGTAAGAHIVDALINKYCPQYAH